MRFFRSRTKAVAFVVAPALFICTSIHTARAAMVATQQVVDATAPRDARVRLHSFLQRGDVRSVLESWGVAPEEATARVDALTDAEVASIAGRLDSMPAGGGAVGIIVGAILLVFFVLLITDLLGLTDVFPFVKKRR